jgi:Ca-activated chloride channel family protein
MGLIMRDIRHGLWFTVTVDATHELGRDTEQVGAVVTVAGRPDEAGVPATATAAEIIIMDRSLSMQRGGKLPRAKQAVQAAIDALPDGTYFAVISGSHIAKQVYPPTGQPRPASKEGKAEAKLRVSREAPTGGTAMGTWLTLADQLFAQAPPAVRHAVLYTDGINEHEEPGQLARVLRACRDHFVCDVRGVGNDWDYRELQGIADALQGKVEAIIDIADLSRDFTDLMRQAQRLIIPRAYLRLRLDHRFRLESIRQIRPAENDLTDHRITRDDGVTDIPLGSWGEESRDYLVLLRVDSAALPYDDEVRAARVDVIARQPPDESLKPCADAVAMTVRRLPYRDAPSISMRITEVQELMRLGQAERAGIDACKRGDRGAAAREFTIALAIAQRLGELDHLTRIKRLVTIDDDGKVRLRLDISQGDLLITGTGSVRHQGGSSPLHGNEHIEASAESQPVSRTCPRGHVNVGRTVNFCEVCGHPFADPDRG